MLKEGNIFFFTMDNNANKIKNYSQLKFQKKKKKKGRKTKLKGQC